MIRKFLIAVLIVVVALVAFIATRPDDLHVERSAQITAPPEIVFPFINDLHNFGRWSPYEKRDLCTTSADGRRTRNATRR
jgi:hypothetical protein